MDNIMCFEALTSDNKLNESTNNAEANETQQICNIFALITYGIITGIVCLFGLIGNIIAFVVYCGYGTKSPTVFLFQGLAVVDGLLLACAIPLIVVQGFPKDWQNALCTSNLAIYEIIWQSHSAPDACAVSMCLIGDN